MLRTVQIFGYGETTGTANVVSTFNGNTVFSGPVTVSPTNQSLFTFDIDLSISGNIPMTMQVSGNTVCFTDVLANYANIVITSGTINGVFYSDINTYSSNIAVIDSLFNSNAIVNPVNTATTSGIIDFLPINADFSNDPNRIINDLRQDRVYINGRLVTFTRTSATMGLWPYCVMSGETMTCNVEVSAGLDANLVLP